MSTESLEALFDLHRCAELVLMLACVGAAIDAFEIIYQRREYCPGGIYDWGVLRTSYRWMLKGPHVGLLNAAFQYPNYIFVVGVQGAAALLLLSHAVPALSPYLVILILVTRMLLHLRNQYGLDGSDQMQLILFAGLAVYYVTPDPMGKHAALWFICLQSILSYLTAGIAKVISPVWRNGRAMLGILGTMSYGNSLASQLMVKFTFLSKALCWAVIVFECAFPLLAFVSPTACVVFIACGVLFHLMIALNMGLNVFFWSFVASYPAIIRFSLDLKALMSS